MSSENDGKMILIRPRLRFAILQSYVGCIKSGSLKPTQNFRRNPIICSEGF